MFEFFLVTIMTGVDLDVTRQHLMEKSHEGKQRARFEKSIKRCGFIQNFESTR